MTFQINRNIEDFEHTLAGQKCQPENHLASTSINQFSLVKIQTKVLRHGRYCVTRYFPVPSFLVGFFKEKHIYKKVDL